MSSADDRLFVGVDRAGDSWLAVAFADSAFDHADVFAELGDLWVAYEDRAERIVVDVPVGLVDEGEAGRRCDELARAVLGERRGSVLDPPVREATRKRRYPAANRVNQRKTGRELSTAAFELSDAIAAVDELLRNVPEAGALFVEAHPEVSYRTFAGEPLAHPKGVAAGYAERMRTLARYDPDAPPTVQAAAEATAGHEVTVPSVLDAVVLGYTASPGPGELRSLPPDAPTDAMGLPMRIVYRSETPLEPA